MVGLGVPHRVHLFKKKICSNRCILADLEIGGGVTPIMEHSATISRVTLGECKDDYDTEPKTANKSMGFGLNALQSFLTVKINTT